jgi:S-adenosylmethionine synthetase
MELFDLRPGMIEQRLKLRQPMYSETAAYGHMGRENKTVIKSFSRPGSSKDDSLNVEVELFTWEKLDAVANIRQKFNIN